MAVYVKRQGDGGPDFWDRANTGSGAAGSPSHVFVKTGNSTWTNLLSTGKLFVKTGPSTWTVESSAG